MHLRFGRTTIKLLLTLIAAVSIPTTAPAERRPQEGFSADWTHLTVEEHRLAPNLIMLHASGANTVALIGTDGTLLVDPSFAKVAPILKRTLQEHQAGPVRYVIDTHHHDDHSGANGVFATDGAVTICHENCRSHMVLPHANMSGELSPSSPAAILPSVGYDKSMTIFLDGEEVRLFHPRPSHTDDDTIVYFRKANVVAMGDVFVNNLYPYFDVSAGGLIDGYMPVLDEVLANIDDNTKVVPGHGPLATKGDLKAYRDMLLAVRDRVAADIAAGHSLAQIIAGHPSREYDAKHATDHVDGDGLVAQIYKSLTGAEVNRPWAAK